MRCPHCRGELPPESQYCGVCGLNTNTSENGLSPSLFALPVSKGARAVRVALIVGINLAMAGVGGAFFVQYLHKRDQVAHASVPIAASNEPDVVSATPSSTDAMSMGASRPGDVSAGTSSPKGAGNQVAPNPKPQENRKQTSSSSTPTTPTSTSKPTSTPKPTSKQPLDAGASNIPTPTSDAAMTLSEEEEAAQVRQLAGKIGLVVRRHQPQLRRCYQNALKQGTPKDPLEGRINLQFTVEPNGSAKAVQVVSNTTGSPTLANCLVGLVRSWDFPATGAAPADFIWPFEFQAP